MEYHVYLAGMMESTPDHGVGWRETLEKDLKNLGISVFNPCSNEHGLLKKMGASSAKEWLSWKKTDRTKFLQGQRMIINYDLDAIDRMDSIIVYIQKNFTGGTIGEITHAYRNLGIPVFGVLEPGLQFHEVGGWVLGCTTTLFNNFADAVIAVLEHRKEAEKMYQLAPEIT